MNFLFFTLRTASYRSRREERSTEMQQQRLIGSNMRECRN